MLIHCSTHGSPCIFAQVACRRQPRREQAVAVGCGPRGYLGCHQRHGHTVALAVATAHCPCAYYSCAPSDWPVDRMQRVLQQQGVSPLTLRNPRTFSAQRCRPGQAKHSVYISSFRWSLRVPSPALLQLGAEVDLISDDSVMRHCCFNSLPAAAVGAFFFFL